jgi:putative protease
MEYAGKFYGENNNKHLPVSAVVTARLGSPMEIKLRMLKVTAVLAKTKFIVEKARKHALDEAAVRKQLSKNGYN